MWGNQKYGKQGWCLLLLQSYFLSNWIHFVAGLLEISYLPSDLCYEIKSISTIRLLATHVPTMRFLVMHFEHYPIKLLLFTQPHLLMITQQFKLGYIPPRRARPKDRLQHRFEPKKWQEITHRVDLGTTSAMHIRIFHKTIERSLNFQRFIIRCRRKHTIP